jgi:glycosyltransferase involved in cell wall biosynthesis
MALPVLPMISIVTPTFNQAQFIEEALLSVKEQNYQNVEHIVIDAASTDGTVEILQRFGSQPGWEHLRWISEPDRGQSDGLNKGFQRVTGDIVGWLNSDDRYRPGCFLEVLEAFNLSLHVDVLYGDYVMIDQAGQPLRIRREIKFSRFMLAYLHILYVPTTTSFFRRRIFDDGNWFDLSLDNTMDYEWYMRLARKGYSFQHVPRLWADLRLHPRSKSIAERGRVFELHDAIATNYSPLLRRLHPRALQWFVLKCLRVVARSRRSLEKLIRGYYFEQFRPLGHARGPSEKEPK